MSGPTENPFSKLYQAHAVPENYSGVWAKEFHDMIAREWLKGMRGGHTSRGWATDEELVWFALSVDWQKRHFHSFPMKGFDEPHWWDLVRAQFAKIARLIFPNPYLNRPAQAIEARSDATTNTNSEEEV